MHALLQLSILSPKRNLMGNMPHLSDLFHGIQNHFHKIGVISFSLADSLERQSHSRCDTQNADDQNLRVVGGINSIEEAYLLSCSDLKKLSRIVCEELNLKNETLDDFTKIEGLLTTIKKSLQTTHTLLKLLDDKDSASMMSLAEKLYSFEDISIDLSKLIQNIKNCLISLEKYEAST
jgi:hypothetical protein